MPQKCLTCDKVFHDNAHEYKCDKSNCHIVKVETIHYLSPAGTGKLKVTKLRYGTLGDKAMETKEEKVNLRLACDHNGNEPSTLYEPMITCKKCLDFIASITNPDVSPDTSLAQG